MHEFERNRVGEERDREGGREREKFIYAVWSHYTERLFLRLFSGSRGGIREGIKMATSSSSSSGLSSGGEHLSWWVLLPSLSPSLPPYNMSRITRLGVTSRRIEGHEKGLRFPHRSPEKIKVFSFFFSFVLHLLLPQSIFFLAPILKNSVPEHRPGFSRVFRCCWGISLSLSLSLPLGLFSREKPLLSTRLTRL